MIKPFTIGVPDAIYWTCIPSFKVYGGQMNWTVLVGNLEPTYHLCAVSILIGHSTIIGAIRRELSISYSISSTAQPTV
jgi:hypothetical protein